MRHRVVLFTVEGMDVTFTKVAGRRYTMSVVRDVGPELASRFGPGYDPYLPHDLVHFVVEAEAGLIGGVFGRVAAGRCGSFWPADLAERRRAARRKRSPSPREHADMARSELLVSVCGPLWEYRSGRRDDPSSWFSRNRHEDLDPVLLDRICQRLGELAGQWHALPDGRGLTLTWPHPEGRRHPPVRRRYRSPVRKSQASRG